MPDLSQEFSDFILQELGGDSLEAIPEPRDSFIDSITAPFEAEFQSPDLDFNGAKSATEMAIDMQSGAASVPKTALGRVKSFAGETLSNVPSSAGRFAGDIFQAITSPIETLKGLRDLSLGVVQKVIPGEQGKEVFADQLGEFFKERYGSLDKALETLKTDPVGFLADSSIVLGGAGATLKGAGLAKAGDVAVKAGRAVEPLSFTKKGILSVVPKVDKVALDDMARAIDINPADASKIKSKLVAGVSPEQWLLERGITGSREQIIASLDDISRQSKVFLDENLTNIGGQYKNKRVNQAINSLRETIDGVPGLENELSRMGELSKKAGKSGLTLSEINEVKRAIGEFESIFKKGGSGVKEGVKAKGLFNIRQDIQKFIEDEALKFDFDAKSVNKQTQIATEIRNSMEKTSPRIAKKETFGLSDLGVAVLVGSSTGSLWTAGGIVFAKKVLQNPKFQSVLAKKLSSLPEKELIGIGKGLEKGSIGGDLKKSLKKIADEATSEFGRGAVRLEEEVTDRKED